MKPPKVLLLLLFVAFVIVYSFVAMLIAIKIIPDAWWAELMFYPVAGILWIFPAMKILRPLLPGNIQD